MQISYININDLIDNDKEKEKQYAFEPYNRGCPRCNFVNLKWQVVEYVVKV